MNIRRITVMGTKLARQLGQRRGKEHSDFALQTIQMMADKHGCIRWRCRRVQPCKGLLDLVQRASGQQAIAQGSTKPV
jgi:hypothetical protein